MLSLLPKLRDQFAEFLKYGSLKALSLLDLFTSVGLQYGDFLSKIFMVLSWIIFLFFSDSILLKEKNFIIVTIKSYPSKTVFTYFLGAV